MIENIDSAYIMKNENEYAFQFWFEDQPFEIYTILVNCSARRRFLASLFDHIKHNFNEKEFHSAMITAEEITELEAIFKYFGILIRFQKKLTDHYYHRVIVFVEQNDRLFTSE